jgi:hypothetical protein
VIQCNTYDKQGGLAFLHMVSRKERHKTFKEFIDWYNDNIHLRLSRKEGITSNEAIINKLQPEAILGLFFRGFE